MQDDISDSTADPELDAAQMEVLDQVVLLRLKDRLGCRDARQLLN